VVFPPLALPPPLCSADARAVSTRVEHSPSSRRVAIAAALVGPAAIFVTANVLQYGIGVRGAATWLDPILETPVLGGIATAVILLGPPVALLLAASLLLPIRLVRDGDAWEVRIRVRADVGAIAIAAVGLLVGGILAGHLVAENLACAIGLTSRC
jgi:hypothetical protein